MIYGEIKISLMEVMGGHFIGMDPPEWADMFCGLMWAWSYKPFWGSYK